jgi:ribosome biogenesis GTPase / thiamine phosphate phosphatase
MTLEDLGYNKNLEKYRIENKLDSFQIGRVIAEHKERYIVKTGNNEFDAEITGNFRYSSLNRSDFPAVGDWVAITEYDDDKALIHSTFPRKTAIGRQAVGKYAEKQIIAVNIDFAFIVQAINRDFNINRIERYLTICFDSNVKPIILLSKIDLITEQELQTILDEIRERIKEVPIIAISNESNAGYENLYQLIEKGKTYCLLGSSGVGKSTLINNLSGREVMKTGDISSSTQKGKHITSHRELFILENGGLLIDNPGMREIGITDANTGLETTFDSIFRFSDKCKYSDCTHIHEKGCAVIAAMESGEFSEESYKNYLKMEKEKSFFESSALERRKKDKVFGKMVKNYKKMRVKTKY